MKEKPDEDDFSKLDIEKIKNRLVHTSEGYVLGLVDDIDSKYLIVRKNIEKRIYYRIPIRNVLKWDEQFLHLRLTQLEAQHHLWSPETASITYNKSKYETVTFRLHKDVMDGVRIDAENRSVSINNLANQILKRCVDYDSLESKAGIMFISKPVVTELFNKKSDEEIQDLAKYVAKDALYNTILFMRGRNDLEAFLEWLEKEMSKGLFNFRHLIENNEHVYIIRHELGLKYCLFLKTLIKEIVKDQIEKEISFTMSDEILLFRLR